MPNKSNEVQNKNGNRSVECRFFITLHTHGHRALLASTTEQGFTKLMPTRFGLLVEAQWHALRLIDTELFCLKPASIHALIHVPGNTAQSGNAQRLLHDTIAVFKADTTQLYNRTARQDYHVRLWAPAIACEPVNTPEQLTIIRGFFCENTVFGQQTQR